MCAGTFTDNTIFLFGGRKGGKAEEQVQWK